MNKTIAELHEKAATYAEKDAGLQEYLLGLANKLEDAEMMRHQFGFLLLHAKSTVPYAVRTRHFQDALDRAEKFLKKLDEQG